MGNTRSDYYNYYDTTQNKDDTDYFGAVTCNANNEASGSWCRNSVANGAEYAANQFFHHYYENDNRTDVPIIFLIHGGGFLPLGRLRMGYTADLTLKLLSWGFQVFELDYAVSQTADSASSFLGLYFQASDTNTDDTSLWPDTHHSDLDYLFFNTNLCVANNGNGCGTCTPLIPDLLTGCTNNRGKHENCCNGQTQLTYAADTIQTLIQKIVDDTTFTFNRDHVGLFGFSVGGFITSEYVRRQTAGDTIAPVKFNVEWSGGSFYNDVQFRTFYTRFMGPNSNSNNIGMYPYNPSAFINITQNYHTDLPFLGVHGQQDTTVPAFFSLSLDPQAVYDTFPTTELDDEFDTYSQVVMLLPTAPHVGKIEYNTESVNVDWLANEVECSNGYDIGGTSNKDTWVPPEKGDMNDFSKYKSKGSSSRGCSKFDKIPDARNYFTVYNTTQNFMYKFISIQ